jgi:hypothetical protein
MSKPRKRFAVCIDNTDYRVSLIPGKLYEVLPDEDAAKDEFIRVIDESGEDYLYHQSLFIPVELPVKVRRALRTISRQGSQASVRSERVLKVSLPALKGLNSIARGIAPGLEVS